MSRTYRDQSLPSIKNITGSADDDEGKSVTAVARIKDHGNGGTYSLDFVSVPSNPSALVNLSSGTGDLRIYFVYTCFIGHAYYPPQKRNWKNGGATPTVHHVQRNIAAPPIRAFERPQGVDLGTTFSRVMISFGDSLMRQLKSPRIVYYKKNTWMFLGNATLPRFLSYLARWHGPNLRKQENTALRLSSSAWDIIISGNMQGPNFDDHLEAACEQYVTTPYKISIPKQL